MLQIVNSRERQNKQIEPKPNYLRILLHDSSLSPVAEAGDYALVATYAEPTDGDLTCCQIGEDYIVRWWRLEGSNVILTDAGGDECAVSLTEVAVIGVVRKIERPIMDGKSPQMLDRV